MKSKDLLTIDICDEVTVCEKSNFISFSNIRMSMSCRNKNKYTWILENNGALNIWKLKMTFGKEGHECVITDTPSRRWKCINEYWKTHNATDWTFLETERDCSAT